MAAFEERVRARDTLYGAWSATDDPAIVHRLASSGVDFVLLDLQHGEASEASLLGLHGIINAAGASPVVRVQYLNADHIGRALDRGARAVLVPNVDTAEQVRDAVACARYAPTGKRSIGPLVPGAAEPLLWVMVESVSAVEALPDILAVPGLGGIIVGPGDLSLSLDTERDPDNPVLARTITQVLAVARDAGVAAGVFAPNGQIARRYREQGASLVIVGSDVVMLDAAVRQNLSVAHHASDKSE